MRALQRLVVAVAVVLVACKGKSPAPAVGSGSAVATAPGSAATPEPGSAATPTPAAGSADTGSAAAPAATGKVFDGPTFSITSTLPGPDTKLKDIDTDAGKTTMTMYEFADPADDNAFQAVETNPITAVSGPNVQKVIDSAMTGMTDNVHAVIDDKKTINVGGTSMLDFTAHFSDADGTFFFRGRVTYKDKTLYQVVAMGAGTKPSPSAETFVSSFHLK